ncbi:hypothetical protein ABN764_26095 [Paenibacillaceae sp. P-4]|uniref:hypothetical protein n=1 Tax=Paenibacillaceae bacterium P-4 TaxID=3160969 RepID=UPI0032E81339
MKKLVISAWHSLWVQHKRAKKVLTVSSAGEVMKQQGILPEGKINTSYTPRSTGRIHIRTFIVYANDILFST